MAALGYFKSPSTNNAVTWDATGAQTDTGLAYDGYKLPTQQTQTSFGGGADTTSPQRFGGDGDPARTHDIYQPTGGIQTQSYSFGPDGKPMTTSTPNAPTAPAKQPMSATQNAAILDAWNKSGSPEDLVPQMNKYGVSISDIQGALSGQGGYTPTAAADYFRYHGYSADPSTGALSKPNAPASNAPAQPQAQPQQAAGPAQQAAGAITQAVTGNTAVAPQTPPPSAGPTSFGGGSPAGAAQNIGGIIGSNGAGQTPNTLQSSSSSTNAGTGPGTWTVSPDQTVEGRIGGIINSNSPLMQQARTRALQQQNEHGTVNSSMATTAADSAVYDAAQRIAQPDAGMFGDAAKTNAMAQTSYGISQNNNQTSRDINSANIGAQKELQHANQLYNNLATQTASANSIQGWGLNTITTIQSSDLSAPAKIAAISSVRQYLADSYKIQGDWHTTAAKTIDAIFK